MPYVTNSRHQAYRHTHSHLPQDTQKKTTPSGAARLPTPKAQSLPKADKACTAMPFPPNVVLPTQPYTLMPSHASEHAKNSSDTTPVSPGLLSCELCSRRALSCHAKAATTSSGVPCCPPLCPCSRSPQYANTEATTANKIKRQQTPNELFQRASSSSTMPATTAVVKSTTASPKSHLAVRQACGCQRPNASRTQLHATVSSGSSSDRPSIEDKREGSVHQSAKVCGTLGNLVPNPILSSIPCTRASRETRQCQGKLMMGDYI